MGIRKPGLKDLVRRAQQGPPDRRQFGPARAVFQCHHGQRRRDIGWVHGHAVIGTRWPHDLPHDVRMATYDVVLSCEDCGPYPLDLSKVRAALRVPSQGIRKVDIKDVLRRVG